MLLDCLSVEEINCVYSGRIPIEVRIGRNQKNDRLQNKSTDTKQTEQHETNILENDPTII